MAAQAGWREIQDDGEAPARVAQSGRVSGESGLDSAVRRLAMALDALDAAVERRADADRNEDTLAAQVQLLGADRARLADKLDAEAALIRELKDTNREVAQRLDKAIVEIQAVLGEDG